jgi:anti-sigma B factor antagonist
MEITSRKVEDVTVVEIVGELTAQTAGNVQAEILMLAEPNATMILDMSQVPFMSSAGLRILLVLYRTIRGRGGEISIVGLSDDLQNTMSVTGFLNMFHYHRTLEAGLADLDAARMRA